MEDKLSSAAELPYFEGDFWPNVLEESIKELDQEEEEKRKQAEAAEAAAAAANVSSASFHYPLGITSCCSYVRSGYLYRRYLEEGKCALYLAIW